MKWNLKKVKVSDLKENPKNPRKLTEKGLKDLEKSITKFGVAEPLVCNTDFMLCGGHGRKKILERLNIKEVDCYFPEKKLTEKQFDELGVRLNRNIAGEFDFDILANEFEVDELIEWGFEEKELDLNLWNDTDESKLDEVPEIPKKALSRLGDLFEIDGKHRVLCGDSTKAEDVEKLMDGKKADMVFTDPPYNLNYDFGDNGMVQTGQRKARFGKIKNDSMSEDDFCNFINNNFGLLFDNLRDGGSYYISGGRESTQTFNIVLKVCKFYIAQWIIWEKENFNISRLSYHPKHEIITYGWKLGKAHYWGADRSQVDVIHFSRNIGTSEHPTQKPSAMIEYFLHNSSETLNIILDTFLGSGSTLIACEQTKRICYGMELDPIYIDVILKRYKKLYPEAKFECLNRKYDFNKLFTE